VCEKLDVCSAEETEEQIKQMAPSNKKKLATRIATLIRKAGLVDASFANIRYTRQGKLAIIDTEPAGLMVAKKPGLWNTLFGQRAASVEKCARIGLYQLFTQTLQVGLFGGACSKKGMDSFSNTIQSELDGIKTPKLSRWKIVLSVVTLGLVALINVVVTVVKWILCSRAAKKVFEKITHLQAIAATLSPDQLKAKVQELNPLQRDYFSAIDGTPFTTSFA